MSANSISPKCFLVTAEGCGKVGNVFVDKEEEKSKHEGTKDKASGDSNHDSQDKKKVSVSEPKWTENVLNDIKLLWNIAVHVDIPAFENYEMMCLFDNHWSTTMEDLELLRRNRKRRGAKHRDRGFLTFGGHWNPNQKSCEKEDCFFGEGHKYEL